MSAEKIRVELGARSYDVLIGPGLIEAAGGLIADVLPGRGVAVVTDANVAEIHLPALRASLGRAGIRRPGNRRSCGRKFQELQPIAVRR